MGDKVTSYHRVGVFYATDKKNVYDDIREKKDDEQWEAVIFQDIGREIALHVGYNHYENTPEKVIPDGWHVPTLEELMFIFSNIEYFQRAFLALGYARIDVNYPHWTSTKVGTDYKKSRDYFWILSINNSGVISPNYIPETIDFAINLYVRDGRDYN